MYPNDAITFWHELQGPGLENVSNNGGPNTILSVSIQQGNVSSDSLVTCGNDPVAKNYATNFPFASMNYQCDDDIYITKTGNDDASFIVTYVPYLTGNFSTTTQFGYNPNTEISSSSDIQILGVFSAGEILIAFLLLCLILLSLIKGLASALSNIKTKKKYLSYGGGDVEVRDDL